MKEPILITFKKLPLIKRLFITIHSLAFFLMAYTFLYFLHQMTTAVAATTFNFPVEIRHNQVYFMTSSSNWNFDSVKIIFSSGPLSILLAGFLFFIIYQKAKIYNGYLKLFFFWFSILAFSTVVGEIMVGTFIFDGLGYVLTWMYWSDTMRIISLLSCIVALFIIGIFAKKDAALAANIYVNKLREEDNLPFQFFHFVFPLIIGLALVNLLKFPGISNYELLVNTSLLIVVIPGLIERSKRKDWFFDEEKRTNSIKWNYILIGLLVPIFLRIILQVGIVM